jgi:NADH-quinone oxidoreductase subunit E
VRDVLQRMLNIGSGQTTQDGLLGLEAVACVGACAPAPVIRVNDEFHAAVTPETVQKVLAACEEEAEQDAREN